MVKIIFLALFATGCTTIITGKEVWKCLQVCNSKSQSPVKKFGKSPFHGVCCECTSGDVHFLRDYPIEEPPEPIYH